MSLIELAGVSFQYKGADRCALSNVNAGFDPGRVYAVMGKPGSGKTTLLALLAGLEPCTGGEVRFRGRSLGSIDRDEYRSGNVGVVFPQCSLVPNATALENVMLAMEIGRNAARGAGARALVLLERVGAGGDAAGKKVMRLTAGERRRVDIARALANGPCVMLAEDPGEGRDAGDEAELLSILASLARECGKCVIIASHSKRVAAVADEVWALVDGRLLSVR